MTWLAVLALACAAPVTAGDERARIRLGQIGLETGGAKVALLPSDAATPLPWTLSDADGRRVAHGETQPFGADAASGERLHRIDFSTFTRVGTGYRLHAAGATSRAFSVKDLPYSDLATEALRFFYQQRSGIPIERAYVQRPDLARAAGHPAEIVTCFAGTDERGVRWPGCAYRLNTTGGWYDAGDQGKYVVNGGLSAWALLDLHTRLAAWGVPNLFADGTLPIPERDNGGDDLLDEARVEVQFLLAMQVPEGQRLSVATQVEPGRPAGGFATIDAGGLAHSKVADEHWTPLPTAPADDAEPRHLYPPTTAATLNLAAVAAQSARVWQDRDAAFAARCLQAARHAWAAAERHPTLYASSDFAGSGGYGDRELSDERFWAAAELYAATGEAPYRDALAASRYLTQPGEGLSWGSVDIAGLMTLATLDGAIGGRARTAIVALADRYMAERARSGYRLPFASTAYVWGSNAVLLNRALVLGAAWQATRRPAYRETAADVVSYLLGRNPLDQSYVTGFGARPMRAPHHRFWAGAYDKRYPLPPPGVLSGGPNSTALVDPIAKTLEGRCVGQTCWVDDWRAYALNEVAINWNAPLVWVAAFLDATGRAPRPAPPSRR